MQSIPYDEKNDFSCHRSKNQVIYSSKLCTKSEKKFTSPTLSIYCKADLFSSSHTNRMQLTEHDELGPSAYHNNPPFGKVRNCLNIRKSNNSLPKVRKESVSLKTSMCSTSVSASPQITTTRSLLDPPVSKLSKFTCDRNFRWSTTGIPAHSRPPLFVHRAQTSVQVRISAQRW